MSATRADRRQTGVVTRVGIIGTGWVANERHIPAYRRLPDVVVDSVFDRNADRARSVARRFRIPRYYSDLAALEESSVEAVSICTPPQAHAEAIEWALQAGKHVLVEKPMTLSSADGARLGALATSSGRLLCPAHNFLFARSTLAATRSIDSGQVGEVRFAIGYQTSSVRRRLPAWYGELSGGLFFDEAPHLLYLCQRFLGPLSVDAAWSTGVSQTPGVRTAGLLSHRIESRLTGQRGPAYLSAWFGAPSSEWWLALHCDQATLLIDLFRDICVAIPPERAHGRSDVITVAARTTSQFWSGAMSTAARVIAGDQSFGVNGLVRRFVDAVNGGEPPTTAEDGARVVALIEDILANAR
jgi:predicted dehydrogenase